MYAALYECDRPPIEALSSEAAAAHRVGLLYMGVDGFKSVNDSLGHNAADAAMYEAKRAGLSPHAFARMSRQSNFFRLHR
ncbi:diguanylate cyclase domain-containing protein [Paraburkholderia kirstenboschensis]|uniref:diguanylate cyclase domain-containing protein n=1 Tax=Paraburkholderia kirstenboschensis TaxID=1245436 RepID=UPI000A8DF524|nr:diguanylate cyclase [Paraburkholderia kirstenboschensis]